MYIVTVRQISIVVGMITLGMVLGVIQQYVVSVMTRNQARPEEQIPTIAWPLLIGGIPVACWIVVKYVDLVRSGILAALFFYFGGLVGFGIATSTLIAGVLLESPGVFLAGLCFYGFSASIVFLMYSQSLFDKYLKLFAAKGVRVSIANFYGVRYAVVFVVAVFFAAANVLAYYTYLRDHFATVDRYIDIGVILGLVCASVFNAWVVGLCVRTVLYQK